jgi:hypothetical protein
MDQEQGFVRSSKMVRAGLGEKQIGDHFVYDPEAHLRNPHGLESDLAKLSTSDLRVIAIIAP